MLEWLVARGNCATVTSNASKTQIEFAVSQQLSTRVCALRRSAFVAVVKSADLRDGDNASIARRSGLARDG